MAGFFNTIALDLKIAQLVMLALLVMIASFYVGTLFGNSPASVFEQPLPAVNGSAEASGEGFIL